MDKSMTKDYRKNPDEIMQEIGDAIVNGDFVDEVEKSMKKQINENRGAFIGSALLVVGIACVAITGLIKH